MNKQTGFAGTNGGIRIPAQSDESGAWRASLSRRTVFAGFLVFAAYYLGAEMGLALTFPATTVSVMWPPNSILLAALLLTPTRSWWFMLLAAFPAHLITELQSALPLPLILCWFVTNCSEALIGAISFRWLGGSAARFDRTHGVALLFLCGGLIGPLLSSFLDSAVVTLNRFGKLTYWEVWQVRFCSNAFTAMTLVPFIVAWGTFQASTLRQFSRQRLIEAVALFLAVIGVGLVVFCWQKSGPANIHVLLYAPLPFLLWAAVRFGTTGTSTAILVVALMAIWGAVHGRGPFTSATPEENALAIQVFFVVISLTLMLLASTVKERSRAEERFTKAFRSSPDAMLVSRLHDGRVIEVNDRWEKLLGYGREETVGKSIFDLNVCTSDAYHERFVEAISHNHFHDLELRLRAKPGNMVYTLVSGDTDDIGGDPCWIFVIRDISDRKRAEEAQQNLAHVSRLAVVGELTAVIAHQINQPLGAILSNADAAEILLDSGKPPLKQIREILADIRRNDLRADEAIKRIRALSCRREMQMQTLDLNETISEVLRFVAGDALRRRVLVLKDLTSGQPWVFGDRVHLQQVLLNLIVNGMDAMNETEDTDRHLRVTTRRNGDCVEVLVSDCGHGIQPEQMPRIFESFFTTKKDGMGLGLSIARSIIEAHRGQIRAENNADKGVTFRFTLPLAERPVNR